MLLLARLLSLLFLNQLFNTTSFLVHASSASLYETLGVEKTATKSEITKAYRKLAMKHHPDKVQGTKAEKQAAEDKFKEISAAYDILRDEGKRKQYDAGGAGAFDFGDAEGSARGFGFDFNMNFNAGDVFKDAFDGKDPFADIDEDAMMRELERELGEDAPDDVSQSEKQQQKKPNKAQQQKKQKKQKRQPGGDPFGDMFGGGMFGGGGGGDPFGDMFGDMFGGMGGGGGGGSSFSSFSYSSSTGGGGQVYTEKSETTVGKDGVRKTKKVKGGTGQQAEATIELEKNGKKVTQKVQGKQERLGGGGEEL